MEDERQKAAGKKAPVLLPRQEKYASQSLREITEQLEQLSGSQKGGQLFTKLCDIVYVLKTQRLRSASDAHAFQTCGGLKALLRSLRACEGKAAALVLGTLGNVCALEGAARREVRGPIDCCGSCKLLACPLPPSGRLYRMPRP